MRFGGLIRKLYVLIAILAVQPATAQSHTVLYSFTGGRDGRFPGSGLVLDNYGTLYGTTAGNSPGLPCSGDSQCGTVFKLSKHASAWTLQTIHTFHGNATPILSDGATPSARLVVSPDGSLYGVTSNGGFGRPCGGLYWLPPVGCGTVFRLTPSSAPKGAVVEWDEEVIHRFNYTDGGAPEGQVTFDSAGNIFGTTRIGGAYFGTVYELVHSGDQWSGTLVYSFRENNDGSIPMGGVLIDDAGNLFGVTNVAGPNGKGSIYEISPSQSGWTVQTLYGFPQQSDGAQPIGGLISDSSGNLYGTTSSYNATVFQLSPDSGTWAFTVLQEVATGGGCGPWDKLVMDGSGNLFGTTRCGGAYSYGSVFELSPYNGQWSYKILYSFSGGIDGGWPTGNVVFGPDSKLYGTTSLGGQYGFGTVFQLTL